MDTAGALDFLDLCSTESDTGKVVDRFLALIKLFGFDVAAGGAWVGVGGTRIYRFYFNNWPKDWLELYEAHGYFDADPIPIETRRRMAPFLLSEVIHERAFTVEGKRVLDAARAYGWTEVMGVPVHGPASYQGLVSMASLKPLTLTGVERGLLRAAALAVHDRAHSAVGHGTLTSPDIKLTPREIDCMRWVAAGKTDAEIAVILGIAPATAHFHVERVKLKAGTRSRTEAVARLVLEGTI